MTCLRPGEEWVGGGHCDLPEVLGGGGIVTCLRSGRGVGGHCDLPEV